MSRLLQSLSIVAVCLLLAPELSPARTLRVSNPHFRSDVEFSGSRVRRVSFRADDLDFVSPESIPVWEICINGTVYSSADPLWRFQGTQISRLSNNASIHTYRFCGRGALKGLTVEWDREFFPSGAFVRERLRLRSATEGRFRLTNLDGRQHFIFPAYSLPLEGEASAVELRMASYTPTVNPLSQHMNHPDTLLWAVGAEPKDFKGPLVIVRTPQYQVVTSYEHASQDRSFMKEARIKKGDDGNDGYQGTQGRLDVLTDDDFWFIGTGVSASSGALRLDNHIRRGGYLDGEAVPSVGWYETVWSTLTLLPSDADAYASIGEYLYGRISENMLSRKARFYYNTWGMQRDMPKDSLYLVMTEERLLREIDHAAQMGLECFVIDDGWEAEFGQWTAHPERLPGGLKPLVDRIRSYGMVPGIWLSLAGARFGTPRTEAHPDWLVRDMDGKPVRGQWRNPVYDIVGPFYDEILSDMKALTDQGIRYFKWDAFNTFSSDLAGLYHGDGTSTRKERMDRYNYLAPFYVVRLMRELREYCPDVVIENDLTESERCMIGLMPLQEGKLYFINNGASRYRDYSAFRSRSLRGVINEYSFFVPQELFTYAMFPQDQAGCSIYNTTSMLSSGHGFWGNLDMTTAAEREAIRSLVTKARKVLPFVEGRLVEREGFVDSSPEIYIQRNMDKGYALVTAFARRDVERDLHLEMYPARVQGVLGTPFRIGEDGVWLRLNMRGKDSCASAFVLGDRTGRGVQVVSSTGVLDNIVAGRMDLYIRAAEDSHVSVRMPDGSLRDVDIPGGGSVNISLL